MKVHNESVDTFHPYQGIQPVIDRLNELAQKGVYVFRGYGKQDEMIPKLIRDTDYRNLEGTLLNDFEKYGSSYFHATTPIDFMSYAQHFGIPTRLLDFTYNPFIALSFSLFMKKGTKYKEYEDREYYYIRYASLAENICVSTIPLKEDLYNMKWTRTDSLATKACQCIDSVVILFSEKEEKRTNVTSKDLSKYQRVDPGDFVLNNQQAWRGSVGVSNHTGIVSPAYIVASLDDTLDRTYANYLLRSRKMVDQYLVISRGVGSIQRNIYWTSLKRVVVPVPPKEEQKMIVSNLEESDRKLSEAAERLMREIETLEEYKTKLIDDVVTGKIDVRGIEIPEYEFVEESGFDEVDEDSDNTDEQED